MRLAIAIAFVAAYLPCPASSGSPPCHHRLRHSAAKKLRAEDIQERLRNATATPGGGGVCICSDTVDPILLDGSEIVVREADWRGDGHPSRVAIRGDPASPHTPRIDARGLSRVLNITFPNGDATLEVAGLHMRRGRAEEGGLIRAVGSGAARGTLVLRGLDFAHACATIGPDESCETWWSRRTSCYGGGGAVLARSIAAVTMEHVSLCDAYSATSGGLLAAVNVVRVAASSVRAERTEAAIMGGAISAFAEHDLDQSSWEVDNVTVVDGTAHNGGGGGVSFWTVGNVRNSTWGVSNAHFTNTSAIVGSGGGVSCIATRDVLDSRWWVHDAHIATANTTGSGGGVILWVGSATHRTLWTVNNMTADNTSAKLGGGALILWSAYITDTHWRVRDVAFSDAYSPDNGGGIQFEVVNATNSTWLIERASLVNTSTNKSGGGMAMLARSARNLSSTITDVSCHNAKSDESGGCMAVSYQEAPSSTVHVTSLSGHSVSARVGALLAVAVPSQLAPECGRTDTSCLPFNVDVQNLSGRHFDGKERGAVISVDAGKPHLVPLREHGSQCGSDCGKCEDFTRYDSDVVPYAHTVIVKVDGISVTDASTGYGGQGGVGAFTNVAVELSHVNASNVRASYSGALAAVLGYSNVTLRDVDVYNCSSQRGSILYHAEGESNITLSGITLTLAHEKNEDLDLVHTGSLVFATASNLSLPCPMVRAQPCTQGHSPAVPAEGAGSVDRRLSVEHAGLLHRASIARHHRPVPFSPRPLLQGTIGNDSGDDYSENHPTLPVILRGYYLSSCGETWERSESRSFRYFKSKVHCKECAEGKYTLIPQMWQGEDNVSTDASPVKLNVSEGSQKCFLCPSGATCEGGDRVFPERGRWGHTKSDSLELIEEFPILLFGYACGTDDKNCKKRYDSCAGNRHGMACGECRPGYGEMYYSADCVSEEQCRKTMGFTWFTISLGLLGIVAFYVHHSRGLDAAAAGKLPSDLDEARRVHRGELRGILAITFTLYQLEAIIRVDDNETASVLSSISDFQLVPTFGNYKFCAWPGMTAATKAALPGILTCCFPILLYVVYLLHARFALSNSTLARKLVAADNFPSRNRYLVASVSIMIIAYGALAGAAIKFVLPLSVDSVGTLQALTGEQLGYTTDFWVAAAWLVFSSVATPFFVLWGLNSLRAGTLTVGEYVAGMVLPAAVFLRHLVKRFQGFDPTQHSKITVDNARGFYWVLTAPYAPSCWAWDGVMMGRRLAFLVSTLAFRDQLCHRHFGFLIIAIVSLIMHVQLQPFACARLNRLETFAQFTLCILCISSLLTAYSRIYDEKEEHLHSMTQIVASVCLYTTFVAAVLLLIYRWRRPHLKQRANSIATSMRSSYSFLLPNMSAPLLASNTEEQSEIG